MLKIIMVATILGTGHTSTVAEFADLEFCRHVAHEINQIAIERGKPGRLACKQVNVQPQQQPQRPQQCRTVPYCPGIRD